MAAVAQPAAGVLLSYSTDNGNTFVNVGQVTSVKNVGGGELGKRDTTVLSSALHTAKPSIPTKGPLSFGLLWDPTDNAHKQVLDWSSTAATADPKWRVVFAIVATPNTCTFSGFVEGFDGPNGSDVDGNLEADVSVYINTVPVWN